MLCSSSIQNDTALHHLRTFVTQIFVFIGNVEPIPALLQDVIDHLIQWELIPEYKKPNNCIINFFDEVQSTFVHHHFLYDSAIIVFLLSKL